ncbi:MAG: tRNA dihydrouridine synthase DusB [Clostridia bacterium]|nr:tRNA dihydrouridine synthase DusB [Clostridia bacterium]
MKIGNIQYKHGLFLAPMAGVTDKSFRALCKMRGAEGMTTEMVSSKALIFKDKKTNVLCEITDSERPCAIQLFGKVPEEIGEAALLVMKYSPCAIDINMGCPAPKIAGNGDGSALMKDPLLCGRIVAAVRKSLDENGFCDIPVTVKIRAGFDKAHINAVEVASACEASGASAIAVHGRTREQMYAPPVNLDIIRNVKRAVSVPVIGNGDINCEEDAVHMLEYTGCDGIMIGRGALGNPYIFEKIAYYLENGKKMPEIPDGIKKDDIIFHMKSLIAEKGEYTGVREARKHIAWYIKGKVGSAALRDEVNRAETTDAVLLVVEKAFG